MARDSHYPYYDVWDENEQWDHHTRKIVGKRRVPQIVHRFLTVTEGMQVQALAGLLLDDIRQEVLTYVTQHIDDSLASPIGESERTKGIPEKQTLYRSGLAGLDELSHQMRGIDFVALSKTEQQDVLRQLEAGLAPTTPTWSQVPQKPFFKQALTDVVNAYYSHPIIWSEIGYGGPAYPRGYVRVEQGLVDPWEAKQDGK